jgi:hypothetical protein
MARLYSYIRGRDILELEQDYREQLIEGMLQSGDYVLFTAEEKVGKTIFSQQLCCALSTGESFLGTFDISRPCKVWYMFNEVRMGQIQERFQAMSHGISINTNNITLIPFRFHFNTKTGHEQLQQIVHENQGEKPDVIILDALYKAIKGTLKDDNVVNEFNYTFSQFAFALGGCARIVVHHLTKPSKNTEGKYYDRTDKDSFGSAFLLADVDHVFRLEKWGEDPNTKERILKCETQRSGEVVESVRMVMVEPDPLMYVWKELHTELHADLLKFLSKRPEGYTVKEIIKHSKISRSQFYNIIKPVMQKGLIEKVTASDNKTKIYRLKK